MLRRKCQYMWKFLREIDCVYTFGNITNGMWCTICGKVMINAHIAGCGCRYCLGCVMDYLNEGSRFCPGNGDDCKLEWMVIDETVLPDHAMNQEISRLIVKCPRDGCEFTCEFGKMEEHERQCKKQEVNYKIDGRRLEKCNSHSRLLMDCIDRLENEIGAMQRNIAYLMETNREQIGSDLHGERISYCDRSIGTLQHKDTTKKKQVISRRMKKNAKRGQTKSEESNQLRVPGQTKPEEPNQLGDPGQNQETSVGQSALGRPAWPINRKIMRQQTRVNTSYENERRCDDEKTPVRDNWINVDKSESGQFLWCIDKWAARRQGASDGSSEQVVFSETFYLDEQGYRMSLSVRPDGCDGNDDLSLGWRLMRGPNDESLSWPFEGSVTVSVINQHTNHGYVSFTVRSDQCRSDDRWQKPISESNYRFVNPVVIDVDQLSRNPAVCSDDRIFIRCVVKIDVMKSLGNAISRHLSHLLDHVHHVLHQ